MEIFEDEYMCHVEDSKTLTNDINSVDIRDLEEIGKYYIEEKFT